MGCTSTNLVVDTRRKSPHNGRLELRGAGTSARNRCYALVVSRTRGAGEIRCVLLYRLGIPGNRPKFVLDPLLLFAKVVLILDAEMRSDTEPPVVTTGVTEYGSPLKTEAAPLTI